MLHLHFKYIVMLKLSIGYSSTNKMLHARSLLYISSYQAVISHSRPVL